MYTISKQQKTNFYDIHCKFYMEQIYLEHLIGQDFLSELALRICIGFLFLSVRFLIKRR